MKAVRIGLFVLATAWSIAAKADIGYIVVDLGTLEGGTSFAHDINNSGNVTGISYKTVGAEHGFFYDGAMHDVGTLGGHTQANGINGSGQIAGYSFSTQHSANRAFLFDGTMHPIGTLGGKASFANGINAKGWVTGQADTGDQLGSSHAFLFDGSVHDLGTLGGTISSGEDVNASGQVAGDSYLAGDAVYHAIFYDGTMHDLGTLGGKRSSGAGINDAGQIAGFSQVSMASDIYHAFFYDGLMHDLGTLGGTYSIAWDINNNGQIVGDSERIAGSAAFLYTNEMGMTDLNTVIDPITGWTLTSANAINDVGQIAGFGRIGGATHAFLLNPVPEPSAIVLFGFALFCLGVFHRLPLRTAKPRI